MRPVYLLDTNVISEAAKLKPNFSVLRNLAKNEGLCAICSTVWQESVYGYERLPDGRRKNMVRNCLQSIKETYDIIPYDGFASEICGEIRARCEEKGRPIPYDDCQIAATAIANGMILVTHNVEDYAALKENSMLKVEDWWK